MDYRNTIRIKNAVAKHCHVTVEEIDGQSRTQPITTYRHIAMYFCKAYTCNTESFIADMFKKDRTSVTVAYRSICDRINTDKNFRDFVFDVKDAVEKALEIYTEEV